MLAALPAISNCKKTELTWILKYDLVFLRAFLTTILNPSVRNAFTSYRYVDGGHLPDYNEHSEANKSLVL
ncbi:hypothetical protein PROFUN_02467 [Planoprotostelium fungivorum]|uniref:Uncharacterized protein n=1 Tax=Planoprotostelium fungivorum TaxID=1890364 RepID=A0A2P6MP13_9EUKA|nr:hypothetical protein PROFUN_02467 [Planoprotostelium fungivorum]